MENGSTVVVEYDQGFTYDNSEISGFYVCCVTYRECDSQEAWQVLEISRAEKYSTTVIKIDLDAVCELSEPTGLAYIWEDTPTERMIGLPIYANDTFGLPAAPWKFKLDQLPRK